MSSSNRDSCWTRKARGVQKVSCPVRPFGVLRLSCTEWKIVVEAYRSAVKEMEAGLKIELPPKATDSEKAVFQTTRNTMQVSLSKVKGRLSDLGQRPESRMFRSSTTLGMPTISSLAKSKHVPVASAATSSKRPTTSTTTSSTSLPTRSVTAPPVARTNSMRGIPGYGSLQRGTTESILRDWTRST